MPYKRAYNVLKKTATIVRDNTIIYALNKIGWFNTAGVYNYLTTESLDTAVFLLCSKLGVHAISHKYLILLILTFII